jgi:dTDP-L-rhamnose 4-epimerase
LKHVLVTGGAGFIGSHLVDALVANGQKVRVLDNLELQVHPSGKIPGYFNKECEFIQGDVRNPEIVNKALDGIEWVVHLASSVGVGQSQYQIFKYTDVNIGGTANVLERVVNSKKQVEKFLLFGSMSSYGEGSYECSNCGIVRPEIRLSNREMIDEWNSPCPQCGGRIEPVGTPEKADFKGNNIYSITKKVQEELAFSIGQTYNIPTVCLRGFNIYGTHQALTNPYNGVVAIFISRLLANKAPVIYEDGKQTRDFISVQDVVKATLLALASDSSNGQAFNLGTGVPVSIRDVASSLSSLMGKDGQIEITRSFRKGDIRHCYADNKKIKSHLGLTSFLSFEEGVIPVIEWAKNNEFQDNFDKAAKEMKDKGLIVS